jgi:hypothetical protein
MIRRMPEDETSPGGSRILRHEGAHSSDEPSLSVGDPDLIQAVDDHLDRCFGRTDRSVFHEVLSPMVHVDVHLVPPKEEFPCQQEEFPCPTSAPCHLRDGRVADVAPRRA